MTYENYYDGLDGQAEQSASALSDCFREMDSFPEEDDPFRDITQLQLETVDAIFSDDNALKECELVSDDDDDVSIEELFHGEDISLCSMDSLFAAELPDKTVREILSTLDQISEPLDKKLKEGTDKLSKKSEILAYIAKFILSRLKLIVFNAVLYLQQTPIWEEIDVKHVRALYDGLPEEITDRLTESCDKEIHYKLTHTPSIHVTQQDLLHHPNLVPLEDAVLDVLTQRAYEAEQCPFFTSKINVSIDEYGKGSGDFYEKYLEQSFLGNENHIKIYEQTQGAILSPWQMKALFAYIGQPNSGKTVSEKLDIEFFKDRSGLHNSLRYVKSFDDLNRLSEKFGLGDIWQKRFVCCPDLSEVKISEKTCAVLKQITGEDLIRYEFKYKSSIDGFCEAKLLILSNHPLRGAIDDALRQRIVEVPFLRTVPREERIPNLYLKLYNERGYIVKRDLMALRDLIYNDFKFTPLDSGVTQQFLTTPSHMDDSLEAFVSKCTKQSPDSVITFKELYAHYEEFCNASGITPTSGKAFSMRLKEEYPWVREHRTAQYRAFRGICLN